MQLFGYFTPRSRDSANTAACGIEPATQLYRQIVQGNQYKMSNPALKGGNSGDDVVVRDWDPTLNRQSSGFPARSQERLQMDFFVLMDGRK